MKRKRKPTQWPEVLVLVPLSALPGYKPYPPWWKLNHPPVEKKPAT